MTVIDTVICPECGDEHKVVCTHEGKACDYCGLTFTDEEKKREHERDCDHR